MILVISHEAAWKAACKKYDINNLDTPLAWPVLLCFEPGNEEDAASNVVVITVEQAAKFLSVCSPNRLVALDAGIRMSLNVALGGVPIGDKEKIGKLGQALTPKVYTGQDQMGNLATIAGLNPSVSFKVGDSIQFNGQTYKIMSVTSIISTTDLITGAPDMVEVKDDEAPDSNIPGLTEIPLDPGKFAKKDKVADLGDAEEHVLDDERDV
jgi:hypothetical protein